MSQAIWSKEDAKLIKNNREHEEAVFTTPCGSITCSDEIEIHMSNNQERVQGSDTSILQSAKLTFVKKKNTQNNEKNTYNMLKTGTFMYFN